MKRWLILSALAVVLHAPSPGAAGQTGGASTFDKVWIYGHKLKWQTGLKYAVTADEADDSGAYEGWSISTGLRVSW
jgi:hypothetical protein